MARKQKKQSLTPQTIMDEFLTGWRTQAMFAGIDLDIFTHIAAGKRTAKDVAEAAGASLRGITNLLDALAGMGHLQKNGSRYALSPVASAFLDRRKKTYVGAMAQSIQLTQEPWRHLTESVKTGRPYEAVDALEKAKEFFPKLVAGIFPGNYATARAAVASLPPKDRRRIRRILDVAAGSAAWSLPFAEAIAGARVTTLDLAETTEITRQFVEKFGLAGRYEYQERDMREGDFGRDIYDLVILGHIIHSEGEVGGKELIRKSYAALRKEGILLIAEYIPNDARTAPAMPLLFGLNMLLHTEHGNVFTLAEYRAWLQAAGFRTVTTMLVPAPSPLILATK
jgi:2-polyprenyl-3-methyl-5-hydroxy-6-metoxy-1,4-benzoquinol methylase